MRRGLLSGQRPVAVGIVFHLSDPFSAHPRQVAIPRWGFLVGSPDVGRRPCRNQSLAASLAKTLAGAGVLER
jgi:hypothetical protein